LKSGLVCHLGAMESISAIYLGKIERPDSVPTSKRRIGIKLELSIPALANAHLHWQTTEEIGHFFE
ncbi:IclR family transcriptional regulator domain-containing protein, partial [Escherichia coli]|uniref:IclR family transcriptional regulator domain-containing protein n=1 Tax=Escherichia coli TaxID=562 RepID=UPI0040680260